MATLVRHLATPSSYKDHQNHEAEEKQREQLLKTTTLYVGNLSFYTTEEQVYELFSRAGEVKRVVMGLDRMKKTPCGFCFVEYYDRQGAEDAMMFVNSTKLDDRTIRTDLDAGFVEGRQFGRGRSGGQVRDEYRQEFDAGRGGWGAQIAQKLKEAEESRALEQAAHFQPVTDIPAGPERDGQAARYFGEGGMTGAGPQGPGGEGSTMATKRGRDEEDEEMTGGDEKRRA
ncbi:MAG: RNA-binding domain-containing protein [Piptocephalis tieghemiana]|nr:MAG: RNA-binding domain-containing protein [Piptocephalis tieghemiana]